MSQDKKTIPLEQAKEVYDSSFRVARTTISVVDAMCQRGAVKGELPSVNCETSVYNLHNYVRHSKAQTKSKNYWRVAQR